MMKARTIIFTLVIVVCFLRAVPADAALEPLPPDAILTLTGWTPNTVSLIQDDPDAATDSTWLNSDRDTVLDVVRVSFPSPSAALVGGADIQEFRVKLQKVKSNGTPQDGGGSPPYTVELYENGSLIPGATVSGVIVTNPLTVSLTWDATGLDPAAIECRVTGGVGGTGGQSRWVDVGAIRWNAEVQAVVNTPPTVTITAPADASNFDEGVSINFTGTASDTEDGNLTANLSWTSSIDGSIGTGGSFSRSDLSVGTHTITASVTDSGALTGQDPITVTVNNVTPTVTITQPAADPNGNEGQSITFAATATDPNDGDISAGLSWSSDLDGVIGSGANFSYSNLSVGVHTITASVADPDGGSPGQDQVTVTVNNVTPTVTITDPVDASNSDEGVSVNFTGTASDPVDGDISGILSWASDLDGAIGSGASFSIGTLSIGTHTITASVTDPDDGGVTGQDQITITINNLPPTVTITQPASDPNATQGDSITFAATATDPNNGDISANLSWSSDLDGVIGTGATFATTALSIGFHIVTASVPDPDGGPDGQDQVTVTVNAPGNDPPAVTITAPSDASVFDEAVSINFTGTASDTEDGDLTASLAWTSSIDGSIGTGGSFSRSDLSIGLHTITAAVTDSGSLTGEDQITITINNVTPTVTITQPAADPNATQGDSITFSATATDPGDGDISANLSWLSNLDGVIGSGATFATTALSVGVHTITASGADPDGGPNGQDQVTVTVNAPPADDVTVNPPTAVIDSCNQITVTVTFTGDDNTNSTTLFERSPNGVDTWTTVLTCGAVSSGSPRVCVDTTVADSSIYYYRTDFTDSDGVVGIDPSAAIGPYDNSLFCSVDTTTIDNNSAEATSCTLITTTSWFTGDDNGDGSTEVQFNTSNSFPGTVACALSGGASPRQCRIPGLTESQDYWLRFHFIDPDGVATGAAPQDEIIGPVNTGACSGDGIAPMVMAIAPSRNAIIGGTDTVKVQVFDSPIGSVSVVWSVDGGSTSAASVNANYDCGTDCSVYEFDLDTTSTGENLANGSHSLSIEATDSDGHTTKLGLAITVNNTGTKAAGSGLLLRRTHGSQLCIDCHNLPTHSSQHTSSKYGNWAMDCTACHTPHKTTNIYLIDGTIDTPNSGSRTVRFENKVGAVADSSVAGSATYVNEDNATQADGVCQACHTRTKSAGGDARWRNADSGGNVDSHYDSAGTSACTGCHTHEAGFSGAGGACDSCHFAPPTVGRHGTHDQVGTLPTSYTALTSTATATQYGFACAKCHSGTHFNDNPKPHTVEVVFDTTVDPNNAGGSFVAGAPETPDPGNNGDGWNWSNGTCDNLYCHSNADPLGGSIAYQNPAPTWDQPDTGSCTLCHDNGGGASDLSIAHRKHTNPITYGYGCVRCHAVTVSNNTTIADKRLHVNGARDVDFDASGVDNSGGAFNGSPGYTCSDTYCHSDGTDQTAPYTSGDSLAWNTTVTCRSCHDGDAAAAPTMSTGKHEDHVNNTGVIGDNYECAVCHSSTVTAGDNETITGFANHVNGASNISGTLVDATYVSSTCTTSYCHSSGQDAGASFEYYDSPDWFTGTADALDCFGCHGRHSTPNVTSNFGEPNYQNGGSGNANANSHQRHVSAATDCAKCHTTTTSNGTQILAGAPHTDETRDVVIAPSWDTNGGSGNYTSGTKTCNSIACHGSGTPQWGGTLTCLGCHGGPDGGILGDGTPNGVGAEWATDGHGAAAGGSLSSALDGCDYCHQLNSAHTPTGGTNPYRLRFATTDNTLCLQCHAAGDLGISQNSDGTVLTAEDSSLDVDTAHYGTKHDDPSTEGGKLCWDCHDPHGVPSNILMVKSLVSKNGDQYGVPGATVAVTFTGNTVVGDFVQTTGIPRTGICQACHDPAGQGSSGATNYWHSDGSNETHNPTKACTDCHFHDNDFAGGGGDCLGCHGDGTGAPARRAVLADFSRNSHHVGSGGTYMGGTLTNFDCVVCHAEGKVDGGETSTTGQPHANGIIDLRDTDHATKYYSYDKDAVGTSAGNYQNWNSSNSTWSTQQSSNMDPFCLSCHDFDGATASYNSTDSGTATNPFGDTQITNEYDQMLRDPTWTDDGDGIQEIGEFNPPWAGNPGGDGTGRVTDIASKVADEWRPASGGYTAADLDTDAGRLAQSIDDPPEGIYSRHAINGQAQSVYTTSQSEWGKVDFWNRAEVAWNETFVMSCADCHTNDGGNQSDYGGSAGTGIGNAHGSDSEYLLKDGNGGALEGTKGTTPGNAGSYNCFLCHSSYYSGDPHFGNSKDYQGYEGLTGISRIPGNATGGGIYGYACANCHGGIGFGSIHGTSQIFLNGAGGSREAYRFTNGASMRFYNPNNWTVEAASCYTLSSQDAPWGGCTKHSGGTGHSKEPVSRRPIAY